MAVTLLRFDDTDVIAASAARWLQARAVAAVRERGRFNIAITGGRSPLGLYRLLAAPDWQARLPWDRTHIAWSDERAVPPDHAESNFNAARVTLLDHLSPPPARVLRMEGEREDLEAAAADYERMLQATFAGADGHLLLDVALLGMGPDGHVASLFPGSPLLEERVRLVVPAEAPPSVKPHWRLTLTLPALAAAQDVLFLVTDAGRSRLAQRVVADPEGSGRRWPAGRVRPRGDVTWFSV